MIRYTDDGKVNRSPKVVNGAYGDFETVWYQGAYYHRDEWVTHDELADALDTANANLRTAEERERKLRELLDAMYNGPQVGMLWA